MPKYFTHWTASPVFFFNGSIAFIIFNSTETLGTQASEISQRFIVQCEIQR